MEVEALVQAHRMPQPPRGDRVARTRESIISSALSLAQAGEAAPIVRDIAKMAGVSARTVFQHFADTAELYVAVLGRMLAAVVGEAPSAGGALPIDQRIALAIDQFSERCERLLPMWIFVENLQRRSPEASDMVVSLYSANRQQLSRCFGDELSALAPEERERTLNALALAHAPESWVMLRQRLGLTVEQAREELRFVTRAIFSTGGARR